MSDETTPATEIGALAEVEREALIVANAGRSSSAVNAAVARIITARLASLVVEAQKFDPSDDYHEKDGDLDAHAYYAGIDRVCALLEGRIKLWTDPRNPPA